MRHLASLASLVFAPTLGAAALAISSPALAAEVTDMPGALQAIGGLHYGGSAEWNALEEGGVRIAGRRVQRHDLDYRVEFAPADGFALVLDLSHTPSVRYAYPDAPAMLIEPVSGGGTYLLDAPGDTAAVTGSGLNGVWLGAALAPFAERYGPAQQATWRVDLAFRTGSPKHNLWTAPDGKRGSAPGGTALKVQGAFSTEMGAGNPWLQATWIREGKVTVDLVDEEGNAGGTDVELQPATTFDAAAGIEIVGYEDREVGTRFAVDLFVGFGYRSWEDVASGVYLPNVIEPARQIAVTTGDQLQGRAGFAFDYHVNRYVRARTGPDVRIHTPFRPEHVYDVTTATENIGIGWVFRLEGMLDLNQERDAAPAPQ